MITRLFAIFPPTAVTSRIFFQVLRPCLLGAVPPLLLLGVAVLWYGSVDAVYARVRGELVFPEQRVVELNDVIPGTVRDVQFHLRNADVRDAAILDANVSCDCLQLLHGAAHIPAGGRFILPARLTTAETDSGRRTIVVRLLLDTQEKVMRLKLDVHFTR